MIQIKLSKSKVNCFLQCPRKFKYENIDMIPQPTPAKGSPLDIGLAIHKIFELFVKEHSNEDISQMNKEDILSILMLYDRAKEFERHMINFADFIYECFQNGYQVYTAEYYIHNLDYDLSGLADLVLIKDNKLTVVDYKTGKTNSVRKYLLELSYYVILCEEEFDLEVNYVGIFFTKGNDFRFAQVRGDIRKGTLLSQEDIDASVTLLDLVNDAVKEGNYQPKRQFLCKYCPYDVKCQLVGGF
ncbi:MAG: PD-(D/E)XK nuclease family protein [Candidatus Pacebacteria bacterium]|nr:PD-(D/E)XK nuclease family protein [Candidatus Paceibacterota bacterium]